MWEGRKISGGEPEGICFQHVFTSFGEKYLPLSESLILYCAIILSDIFLRILLISVAKVMIIKMQITSINFILVLRVNYNASSQVDWLLSTAQSDCDQMLKYPDLKYY